MRESGQEQEVWEAWPLGQKAGREAQPDTAVPWESSSNTQESEGRWSGSLGFAGGCHRPKSGKNDSKAAHGPGHADTTSMSKDQVASRQSSAELQGQDHNLAVT